MEDRAIEYKPPETISQGLKESMLEERSAADFYRRRGMHARLRGNEGTADLYEDIAREEDHHFDEFKEREHIIMSEKEVQHWKEFGVMDLNMIIGTTFGEGAIPVNGRETRKAPCRGCRIDTAKPLEAGNCMVTTEDAIGTLSPNEVRDWCSGIVELQDGRCERARAIKEAARECKEKHPNDTEEFFACYAPAFAAIAKKREDAPITPEVTERKARYGFLQLNEAEYEEALKSGRYPEPTRYEKLTGYYTEPREPGWKGLSLAEMFPTKYKDLLKRGVPDQLSPLEVKTVIEEKRIPYGRGVKLGKVAPVTPEIIKLVPTKDASVMEIQENGVKVGDVIKTPVQTAAGEVSTWRFVPTDETLARKIGGFSGAKTPEEALLIYNEKAEITIPEVGN